MHFDLSRIGAGLPVARTISELPGLIERTGSLVVEAPPGTGKTTLIPPALHNHTGGKVLATAPRRVAVRAAAHRLTQLAGPGAGVGYTIRGERKPGSTVEFCTPGVLLRRLIADPSLNGIAAAAVDEVHERQVDTDIALGMLIELAELRDDFRLVAMSATLDAQRYSDLLGDAPVLSTPAVTHPLDISYELIDGRIQGERSFFTALGQLAAREAATRGESALVFVPGVREVEMTLAAAGPNAVPLHGRLSSADQDAALRDTGEPRVVVATSIAESSLTVPGVRIVVDSGLSRVPRRDSIRNMTGLVTVSEAKSTADQRAGRAGREGPGTVIRSYSQADYQHFHPHITPEIATSDLTDAALTLACWGTPRGEGLPLLDPPPTPAMDAAEEALRAIGAVDTHGRVTEHGLALARIPLDPRHAHALSVHGSQAAQTIAELSGAQITRLRKLVPDRGPADPGTVIATAFPQLVARKEGDDYLLASGTRATLGPGVPKSDWLAVADVSRTRSGFTIRDARPISEAAVLEVIGISESTTASLIDGALRARRIRHAGAIELSSTPVPPTPELAGAISITLDDFTFSDKASDLRDRLQFLHDNLGDPWPSPAEQNVHEWLAPELEQLAAGTPVKKIDMYPALQRLLPWPEAARLDELAPARLEVPSGSHPRVSYAEGRPVVRVKLQECFGLSESPRCAGIPVQFHLLSPAGRPLAVTDDLESFWSGPYEGVRKDMRGRYPKHPWPEDPWSAQATAKTKKAAGR